MEIEEVPNKTKELVQDALHQMELVLEKLKVTANLIDNCNNDYSFVISSIDSARQQMSNSDQTLIDSQTILEGLNNYYNGEEHVPEGRPTVDPSGDTITQTENSGEG
tara:strand:- start:1729 stop:2049 length:321 start_codon:yes stop_codon:yes gene_type:complete